ncbi:MAG: hypothetical protein KJO05_04060 [Bacteroidia bacterium]|nr:hypothetical protein [Bacteroidia bacterium]NNF30936.1 hypothetical protein [Flavobacteriaceae bacterium]MBT8275726.1 hypothetical protein [Bacteroidia bacterium]NNJ82343.1 hypothetical protein [Flavobacteriaceae bacterium]NNK54662.1 hypothetical protein [Flavobacteriaceae bacterium]
MKKIFYLFLVTAALISCNNSEEKKTESTEESVETNDDVVDVRMPVYRGEFILTDEAAVLKGKDFIYGVTLDTMARELAERVAPIKRDEFDMVPVIVTGVVSENPALAEGKEVWEEVITIKKIINVSARPSEADVKIQDKN